MPTKYILNQSYNAQPSTAPSNISNSYIETMSKVSNSFNENVMEKLKVKRQSNRKRYDFDEELENNNKT